MSNNNKLKPTTEVDILKYGSTPSNNWVSENTSPPDLKLVSNRKHKIKKAVDFVSENYRSQIRMKDLSKALGIENSKFSRQFYTFTGYNFSAFVNRTRIDNACQLLIETDKYISTICYETGYNSLANFNRRFLELKHITPTEYRFNNKSKTD